MQPFITIDTDNATIRVYVTRARAAGMTDEVIARLRHDADAIRDAVSAISSTQFTSLTA